MNEWDEWKKRAMENIALKAAPPVPTVGTPAPVPDTGTVPKRPLTDDELAQLKRLRGVSVGKNSRAANFILQFSEPTMDTRITERQAFYIQVLWYRYRKQLGIDPPRPIGYV